MEVSFGCKLKIIFILLILALPGYAEEEPVMSAGYELSPRTERMAKQYENDIKSGRLAKRSSQALNAIIRLAAYKLNRVGHKKQAKDLIYEWEHRWDGEIVRLAESRGIGDHKPLSKWLADKFDMMEFILGKSICEALRLTDIKTINFSIPIVISCVDNISQEEFRSHFVFDYANDYKGLCPVVVYWVSFFSCVGASWGTGFIACAPISTGTEWLALNFVAPKLSEPLWKLSCSRGDF